MTKEEITAAMKKLRFEARWVTPEQAKAWLDGPHIDNRSLKKHNIDLWSRLIKAGKWSLTGDCICFADNGMLIDGQNRLKSIIKADEEAPLCIIWNLPYDSYLDKDQGSRRTTRDMLTMSGYKSGQVIASAMRAILLYQKGQFRKLDDPIKSAKSTINFDFTPRGITEFTKNNPEIEEIVMHANNHIYQATQRKGKLSARPSTIMLCYYIFSKKSKILCEKFFEAYAFGADLSNTHPVVVLRQKLFRERQIRQAFLPQREELILFIYAWNAVRQDKKLTSLTISEKAPFPTIL